MQPLRFAFVFTICGFLCSACQPEEDDSPQEGEGCDPVAEEDACADGLVCEPVGDTTDHVCAAALEVRGMVVDALTEEPIEGALVAALDESSAPVTDVVETDAEGNYTLAVSARRDADGLIADNLRWTLNVTAMDYVPYPSGVRPAIPVDAQQASEESTGDGEDAEVINVIENPTTTVALVPLAEGDMGGVTVSGVAEGEVGVGTLVVAEELTGRTPHAIADASGAYTLFNVPAGEATVEGYRAGLEFEPTSVTVGDAALTDVDLVLASDNPDDLGVVSGSLEIVDAPGGAKTSVVLVPVSVYNDILERGPVPFALRAPEPPEAVSITSGYEIAGVPAGTYKVLPAFENDDLVRDPDASIAGTQILEITVGSGEAVTVDASFKVTEALPLIGPGQNAPEPVGAMPTFRWKDDASETSYGLKVYDALGDLVWEQPDLPSANGGDVEVAYDGPALEAGMYYQFRVTSYKTTPQGTEAITRTEDLRGMFVVE